MGDLNPTPGADMTMAPCLEIAYHEMFPWLVGKLPHPVEVKLEKVFDRTFTRSLNWSFSSPVSAIVSFVELMVGLLPFAAQSRGSCFG